MYFHPFHCAEIFHQYINGRFVDSRQTDKLDPQCDTVCVKPPLTPSPLISRLLRERTVHKSFPVTHVYLSVRPSLPLADQRSIRCKVRVHSRALRSAPSPAAAVAKQSTDMFSMREFYLHFRHCSC